jgi:hypothetical protein
MMTFPGKFSRSMPSLYHLLAVLLPICGAAIAAGDGAGPDTRKPNILLYLTGRFNSRLPDPGGEKFGTKSRKERAGWFRI